MFWHKTVSSFEEAVRQPKIVRRLKLHGARAEHRHLSLVQIDQLLRSCPRLQELHLGWFAWTELPKELITLERLRSLVVLNVPLEGFPAFLAACPQLSHLVLRGTEITHVPDSIRQFRRLRELDLGNSPLASFSPEARSGIRHLRMHDTPLYYELHGFTVHR